LASVLNNKATADQFGVFQFRGNIPRCLAAVCVDGTDVAKRQVPLYLKRQYWRRDPFLSNAFSQSDALRVRKIKTSATSDPDLRSVYVETHIHERMTICGRRSTGVFWFSILRTDRHGMFSSAEVDWVTGCADFLLSTIAKHYEVAEKTWNDVEALTNLSEIKRRTAAAAERLPRRELDVCARILYGLSANGIALDLGLSEETVATYRKRAFHRLGIASRRELLLWYLGQRHKFGPGLEG
jgi:DNA-binding CsgD family transcriptional regulator